MFRRLPATLQAALALVLLLATVAPFSDEAYAQGNSAAAARCQQLGYQQLVRADLTPFRNTGDCVHYRDPTGTPPLILANLVQLTAGPYWTDLSFAGSGFTPNSGIRITATSLPPGVPFSYSPPPSFGTDSYGAFTLTVAFWPSQCLGYLGGGPVRLTATDTLGRVASVTFQVSC
jgi:hypothetical protein